MPQYTVASPKIRYLRSVRFQPSLPSAVMVASKVAIAPAGTSTSCTSTVQSAVVTKRMCRSPPVSWALASYIASTPAAQDRNDASYGANRLVVLASRT